jgi:hypothetical protein
MDLNNYYGKPLIIMALNKSWPAVLPFISAYPQYAAGWAAAKVTRHARTPLPALPGTCSGNSQIGGINAACPKQKESL